MFKTLVWGLCIMVAANCGTRKDNTISREPVNPNACQKARTLLNFLYNIEGKVTLSGHHNYTHEPTRFTGEVKEMTGKTPVVWGSDFGFQFRDKDPHKARSALIDTALAMHEKGHIITLMWHSCFPGDGTPCSADQIWLWQPGLAPETWDSLVTPGTELHQKWLDQIDEIAMHLKRLQKARVPVLWRPYHEMNGIWFWWCNKRGSNGFVKLWRLMFDRFVNHHHLDNLLWVWNPNAPRDTPGDEAFDYELFFPGIDVVDILAADVYHFDYRLSHHEQLLELAQGKPIALGEVGKLPTPEILQEQPQWTWFMGWANWLHKANSPDSVQQLYQSERVISLDRLHFKQGRYRIDSD